MRCPFVLAPATAATPATTTAPTAAAAAPAATVRAHRLPAGVAAVELLAVLPRVVGAAKRMVVATERLRAIARRGMAGAAVAPAAGTANEPSRPPPAP